MDQLAQIDSAGFGARLKQERERLGLTLSEFGSLGEVNRMTQMRYEVGANSPSVEYLDRIGRHGVDTMFLVAGIPSSILIPLRDPVAFSQAIDLVDAIAELHKFVPPPEFRVRAILGVYERILKFGAKKVKPTLEDLLHDVQET